MTTLSDNILTSFILIFSKESRGNVIEKITSELGNPDSANIPKDYQKTQNLDGAKLEFSNHKYKLSIEKDQAFFKQVLNLPNQVILNISHRVFT